MFKLIIYLCLVLFVYKSYGTSGNVPLTQCMKSFARGTDALTDGSCGYGQYDDGDTGQGTFTVTYNNANINCGDCLEVVGPKGSVVVKAVNYCPPESCPMDRMLQLSPMAFSRISDDPLITIYDAGFRKVSCNSDSELRLKVSNDSSEYFLNILFYNNNVGISSVTIKDSKMTTPMPFARQRSAYFQFAQSGKKIQFPATITATSVYGDRLTYQMDSVEPEMIDSFSKNFATPQPIAGAPQSCILSQTPTTIYNESLAEGYDTWSSKSYKDLNLTDSSIPAHSGTNSLRIRLIGDASMLTISRAGQFQTDYFLGIKFSIRADRVWSGLKVFFRSDSFWTPPHPIGSTEWSTYSVLFSDISHNPIEKSINWGNNENKDVTIWLDDVSFILNPSTENISTSGVPIDPTVTSTSSLTTSSSTSGRDNGHFSSTSGGISTDGSIDETMHREGNSSSTLTITSFFIFVIIFLVDYIFLVV